MVIDLRKCVGCHSCAVACKSENNVPLGVHSSWVKQIEKGTYPHVAMPMLPRLCNHCTNPPCVKACPTRASYQRDDGVILIETKYCIGCKACISACPYDARYINPKTMLADKCSFCDHRIDEGLEPACISTCIGRARIFGDLNDPNSEVSRIKNSTNVVVLKHEARTHPNVFYINPDSDVMMHVTEGEE